MTERKTVESTGEIAHHHSQKREIAYNREFRGFLREHPGIINTARQLTSQGEANYHPDNFMIGLYELQYDPKFKVWEEVAYNGEYRNRIAKNVPNITTMGRGTFLRPGTPEVDDKTGLEVTILGVSNRQFHQDGEENILHAVGAEGVVTKPTRIESSTYLKARLGDKSYFIKKATQTSNPGSREFLNTVSAADALRDLDFVTVSNAQLGYQDSHESWYISDWKELESEGFFPYQIYEDGGFTDSGQYIHHKTPFLSEIDGERIFKQKKQIDKALWLQGIVITDTLRNFFYNYKTGKFFLLDVTTTE